MRDFEVDPEQNMILNAVRKPLGDISIQVKVVPFSWLISRPYSCIFNL